MAKKGKKYLEAAGKVDKAKLYPVDEAITLAIIALSHSLNLRVIAEGVETAAQYEFLKRHDCVEAQGCLISKPLEESELRQWWDAMPRYVDRAQSMLEQVQDVVENVTEKGESLRRILSRR